MQIRGRGLVVAMLREDYQHITALDGGKKEWYEWW
jgi:hypothetical protein